MRGKVQPATVLLVRKGITPAYAGKSHTSTCYHLLSVGSPPPMRGKVISQRSFEF